MEKRKMEIKINLDRRYFFGLFILLIVVLGVTFVAAWVNPAGVGHDWTEVICDNNLCVKTDGKVGIGTINPDSKFTVVDGKSYFSLNGGNNPGIEIKHIGDNSGLAYIDFSNDPNSDFDGRIILVSDDILSIEGVNLGIGTLAPRGKLDVTGAILAESVDVSGNLRGNGLCIEGICEYSWSGIRGSGGSSVDIADKAKKIRGGGGAGGWSDIQFEPNPTRGLSGFYLTENNGYKIKAGYADSAGSCTNCGGGGGFCNSGGVCGANMVLTAPTGGEASISSTESLKIRAINGVTLEPGTNRGLLIEGDLSLRRGLTAGSTISTSGNLVVSGVAQVAGSFSADKIKGQSKEFVMCVYNDGYTNPKRVKSVWVSLDSGNYRFCGVDFLGGGGQACGKWFGSCCEAGTGDYC